jgi:hypothetical protein
MEVKTAVPSFRELAVWQKSMDLATTVAEGQGRVSTGEFRQFLGVAQGSNFELQTQIEIARDLV